MSRAAIRRTFRRYFWRWRLRLPRSLGSGVGTIVGGGGWHIQWRTGFLRGRPYLDFYAAHRMTNDRHHRIFDDGRFGHLPAKYDWTLVPMGAEAEERAQIQDRHDRHNRRIAALARAKFGEQDTP